MKSLWYLVPGGMLLTLAALFGWYKRRYIKSRFDRAVPKVKGTARRVWGRVERATDDLLHTEREPQPQAPNSEVPVH